MAYPTESDVKKIGPAVRVLAGFLLLCALFVFVGLSIFILIEPFEPIMVLMIVATVPVMHVSGSVAFKGYAPKYLLFAHGEKSDT